jgi:hypothetical protein
LLAAPASSSAAPPALLLPSEQKLVLNVRSAVSAPPQLVLASDTTTDVPIVEVLLQAKEQKHAQALAALEERFLTAIAAKEEQYTAALTAIATTEERCSTAKKEALMAKRKLNAMSMRIAAMEGELALKEAECESAVETATENANTRAIAEAEQLELIPPPPPPPPPRTVVVPAIFARGVEETTAPSALVSTAHSPVSTSSTTSSIETSNSGTNITSLRSSINEQVLRALEAAKANSSAVADLEASIDLTNQVCQTMLDNSTSHWHSRIDQTCQNGLGDRDPSPTSILAEVWPSGPNTENMPASPSAIDDLVDALVDASVPAETTIVSPSPSSPFEVRFEALSRSVDYLTHTHGSSHERSVSSSHADTSALGLSAIGMNSSGGGGGSANKSAPSSSLISGISFRQSPSPVQPDGGGNASGRSDGDEKDSWQMWLRDNLDIDVELDDHADVPASEGEGFDVDALFQSLQLNSTDDDPAGATPAGGLR